MTVSEIMTTGVQSCWARDDLASAAALMWDADCGFVPVLDDDGRLAGIVTDRDLCMAALTKGRSLHQIPLRELLESVERPTTVKPDDEATTASGIMREHQIRRLPVVDSRGGLLGIVSLGDLARSIVPRLDSAQGALDAQDLVHTLATICQPRSQPEGPASGR